ncbi:HAD hydrolase family protein [Escherichia coli]
MTTRVIALDLRRHYLTRKRPASFIDRSPGPRSRSRLSINHRHSSPSRRYSSFYQALALDTPAICCNGTYLYDYHAKTVWKRSPMPVIKALQLVEMLNERRIHGLMYVDDAMVYEHPTGHVIRTSNWARTLRPEQRPTFTQVASLAETARRVNAVWKFALTHDDLPQLPDILVSMSNMNWDWSV